MGGQDLITDGSDGERAQFGLFGGGHAGRQGLERQVVDIVFDGGGFEHAGDGQVAALERDLRQGEVAL